MLNRTLATLKELNSVNWFENVGRKDTDFPIFLSSWSDAVESCASGSWEDLCLEAANQYRLRLAERDKEQFSNWNTIAKEVKKLTIPLVIMKTAGVVKNNNLPKIFVDTVQWDIMHLCMESEFTDVYPSGFYASQAYWYLKGHFPCGWRGVFPEGRLLVF